MKNTIKKVKKSTLTIRVEGEEYELIEALKLDTKQKSATRALFEAARYFLNDRILLEDRLNDTITERDKLRNQLQETEEFFSILRKHIAIKK